MVKDILYLIGFVLLIAYMQNKDLEMDLADQAQQQNEILGSHIPRKPEGPSATGRCLNCEEKLPPGVRWCDADCRTDWERLNGGKPKS